MRLPRRLCSLLLPLLAALISGGCAALPPPSAGINYIAPLGRPEATDKLPAHYALIYDQAASWIRRRYYDPNLHGVDWTAAFHRHRPAAVAATTDAEFYTALNRLLGELHDEHTHAYSAAEAALVAHRKGVLLGFRSAPLADRPDARLIVSIFRDSPADVAGVKPGWILLAANGRPPKEVLGVGKLADGQSVRCDFLDAEGKPACLDIRARRMSYPPVRDAHRLPGSVLLLSFDTFDMPTARWLRRELKRQPPAAGLILDLRENSGGEARALAAIVAEIFPNPICIGKTRTRSRSHPEQHRSPRHSLAARYEGPLALIVSDATASAAEILAAVVQHEQRGTVVGMRTSGNVLVCVRWPMPDGGRLQLSVYDFIGPDGCRLEGKGVAPDIEVRPATGSPLDPQVEAALAALKRAAQ